MNPRNRFFILLGIIFLIALGYYFFSTPRNRDLVLIGTVDSNQVIVSPKIQGRLRRLLVDEGSEVKAGDLIVIYLAKRNRGPAKCPAVVRALGPAKKEESFLRRERDAEAAERWPWVTRIEVIGDVPADDGVGLDPIDMSPYSLQHGPREITRDEFEALAGRLVG